MGTKSFCEDATRQKPLVGCYRKSW